MQIVQEANQRLRQDPLTSQSLQQLDEKDDFLPQIKSLNDQKQFLDTKVFFRPK